MGCCGSSDAAPSASERELTDEAKKRHEEADKHHHHHHRKKDEAEKKHGEEHDSKSDKNNEQRPSSSSRRRRGSSSCSSADTDKAPAAVLGEDGEPLADAGGNIIYDKDEEGKVLVLDEHGKPALDDTGKPVYVVPPKKKKRRRRRDGDGGDGGDGDTPDATAPPSPMVDRDGKALLDAEGNAILDMDEDGNVLHVDEEGKPVLDKNGKPVYVEPSSPLAKTFHERPAPLLLADDDGAGLPSSPLVDGDGKVIFDKDEEGKVIVLDDDGKPVLDDNGKAVYVASSDARSSNYHKYKAAATARAKASPSRRRRRAAGGDVAAAAAAEPEFVEINLGGKIMKIPTRRPGSEPLDTMKLIEDMHQKFSRLEAARDALGKGLKTLDDLGSTGDITALLAVQDECVELADLLDKLATSAEGIEDSEKASSLVVKVGTSLQQLSQDEYHELTSMQQQRKVGAIAQLVTASRQCIELAAEERRAMSQRAKQLEAELAAKQVTDTKGLPDAPTSSRPSSSSGIRDGAGSDAGGSPSPGGKKPGAKKGAPGSRGSTPTGKRGSPAAAGRYGGAATPPSGKKGVAAAGAANKQRPAAPSPKKKPSSPPRPKVSAASPSSKRAGSVSSASSSQPKGRALNSSAGRGAGGSRVLRNLLYEPPKDEDDESAKRLPKPSPKRKPSSKRSATPKVPSCATRTPKSRTASPASSNRPPTSPKRTSTSASSPKPRAAWGSPKAGSPTVSATRRAQGGAKPLDPSALSISSARTSKSVTMRKLAGTSALQQADNNNTKRKSRVPTARECARSAAASLDSERRRRMAASARKRKQEVMSEASQIIPTMDSLALCAPTEQLIVQLMHSQRLIKSRGFADMPIDARSHVLRMVRDMLCQCRAKAANEQHAGGEAGSGGGHSGGGGGGGPSLNLKNTQTFLESVDKAVTKAEHDLVQNFARTRSPSTGRPSSPFTARQLALTPSFSRPGSPYAGGGGATTPNRRHSASRGNSPLASSSSLLSSSGRAGGGVGAGSANFLIEADAEMSIMSGSSGVGPHRFDSPIRVLLGAYKFLMSADFVNALPYERDQALRLIKSQLASAKKVAAEMPEERRLSLTSLFMKITHALEAYAPSSVGGGGGAFGGGGGGGSAAASPFAGGGRPNNSSSRRSHNAAPSSSPSSFVPDAAMRRRCRLERQSFFSWLFFLFWGKSEKKK